MNEIFKLFGTIAIDNNRADKAIDETGKKGKDMGDKLKKGFEKAGKFALSAGKTIAVGLGAGIAAMGTLITKGVNLAGELEQNVGGSEAVFGESAKKMQKTASEAFEKMGLSASDYLATANKMGSLYQGSGIAQAESADLAAEAMQRAADVASIMGIDIDSAMESVAGMAKGNYTMMDNLGVAMNETSLKAYLLESGLAKNERAANKMWKKMSQGEKVALATQMFMDKTAQYAGNYANENETLAGSLSTAKAAMTNFLSGVGDADQLAGAITNAADVIGGNVLTLLPKLTSGITTLVKKLTPKIPGILKNIMPGLITGALALLTGLVTAAPELVGVIVDMIPDILSQLADAVVSAWPILLQSVDGLLRRIDWQKLGEWAWNGVKFLISSLPQMMISLGDAINYAWNNIVWKMIQGIFKAAFGVDLPDWSSVLQGISDGWNNTVWPGIQGFFKTEFDVDVPEWSLVSSAISDGWGIVWDGIKDLFRILLVVKHPDWESLKQDLSNGWANNVWTGIKDYFELYFNIHLPDWETIVSSFTAWKASRLDALKTAFSVAFSVNNPLWSSVYESITSWWSSASSDIDEFFVKTFGIKIPTVASVLKDIRKLNTSVQARIIDFFKKTFSIKLPSVDDVVRSISEWWENVKKSLGSLFTFNINWGQEPSEPTGGDDDGTFATGLDFVPRDNFAARLHQGEAVLTRNEANDWRTGKLGNDGALLDAINTLSGLVQQVVANTGAGTQVVLDSGVLVGQMSSKIDTRLGTRALQKGRGN